MRRLAVIISAVAALAAAPLHAQRSAAVPTRCAYERCALGVEPRWSGLALVRGTAGERVGELGFFWPRDVRPLFAGSDSATHYASRAVAERRIGAVLTDVGGALVALGALRVARTAGAPVHGTGAWVAGAGVALLGASVPVQFAADGWLSRAVWWHNARFSR